MSMPRFTIAFAAASLLTAIIVAQEVQLDLRQPHFSREQLVVLHDQEGARAAKFTLWAIYAGTDGEYQDQAQYLADLQARFRDQSIAVTVVLPKAHAAEVASSKPRFVVATCNPAWNLTSIPGMHMVISAAGDGHALTHHLRDSSGTRGGGGGGSRGARGDNRCTTRTVTRTRTRTRTSTHEPPPRPQGNGLMPSAVLPTRA